MYTKCTKMYQNVPKYTKYTKIYQNIPKNIPNKLSGGQYRKGITAFCEKFTNLATLFYGSGNPAARTLLKCHHSIPYPPKHGYMHQNHVPMLIRSKPCYACFKNSLIWQPCFMDLATLVATLLDTFQSVTIRFLVPENMSIGTRIMFLCELDAKLC